MIINKLIRKARTRFTYAGFISDMQKKAICRSQVWCDYLDDVMLVVLLVSQKDYEPFITPEVFS